MTVVDPIRDKIDDAMLERISDEYTRTFERQPTLSEVLASVRFVIADPDTYLELPENARVLRIAPAPPA